LSIISMLIIGFFIGFLVWNFHPICVEKSFIVRDGMVLYPPTIAGFRKALVDLNNSKDGGVLELPRGGLIHVEDIFQIKMMKLSCHGNNSIVIRYGCGYQRALDSWGNPIDSPIWCSNVSMVHALEDLK
jgi:hypothetical protein